MATTVVPSDGAIVPLEKTKEAMALVNEKKRQEIQRKLAIGDMVNEIKISNFFRMNWDELLIAAPNCLELMATCTQVASSDAAAGITLTLPLSGKFKYLNFVTLKGCLAQVSNQGARSFDDARRKMSELEAKCGIVRARVLTIVEVLKSIDGPMFVMVNSMEDIKKISGECVILGNEMYHAFDLWSEMTKELWAHCTNETAVVEQRQKALEEKLAYSQRLVEGQSANVEEMKKAVKKMEDNMNEAKSDYKQTLDDFPGAWTLAGQQIVMGLTDGLCNASTVAASIATQNAMTAVNPTGTLAAVAGKFGTTQPTVVVVGNQQASPTTGTTTAASATQANSQASTTTAPVVDEAAAKEAQNKKESALSRLRAKFTTSKAFKSAGAGSAAKKTAADGTVAPAPAPASDTKDAESKTDASATPSAAKPATVPEKRATSEFNGKFYASDPAMSVINVIEPWVTTIQNILVDSAGARAVDWTSILPPGKKDDKGREINSEAQTVFYNLERKKKEFNPDPKGLASQLTTRVISETYQVVKEMLEEAKKSKGISEWEKPADDSEIVKSWDERIAVCAEVSTTLKQSAVSQPGMAPGMMQSLFPKKTEAETVASSNLRASVAEQTVKAATAKLTSAQEVYKSTLATYQSMNEQKLKMQEELTKAQAEVAELQAQGITAENVRKILVQCIGFLAQLKSKIAGLVEFFSKVSIFVESIVTNQIKSFQDNISGMMTQWPNDTLKQFRYNAFLRDNIFRVTLQIMGQFSLCRDVAIMYSEVHDKCIKPGLYLVDKCGIPAAKMQEKMTPDEKLQWSKQIEDKKAELTKFALEARTTVQDIVKKKQDEMLSTLRKRIDDIDKELGEFPAELKPLPQSQVGKALEDGKLIASSAATEEAMSQPSTMGLLTGNDEIEIDSSGNF